MRLAEQAKIAFSAPGQDSYPVKYADLQPVLRAIDLRKVTGLPELFPLLPKEDLLVLRAGFETLARPMLRQAAELAGWLVRTTFEGQPGYRLNQVVLSGKTSRLPLLSEVVTEVLAGDGEAGRRLHWNPAALAEETERAKQAAPSERAGHRRSASATQAVTRPS